MAFLSAGLVVVVGIEAAWRIWRSTPATQATVRLQALLVIAVAITIAGGLGLVAAGAQPLEPLHYVYALLALLAVPVASTIGRSSGQREQAIATLVGALIALVLVARLFQTGSG